MIDIHSHILFNADDGPDTIEQSIQLLEKAAQEGITDIISTSHAFSPHHHVQAADVQQQIRLLQNIVKEANLPIQLWPGHEVRLHEHLIDNLKNGEALPLADANYVLLELPSGSVPAYTNRMIENLLAAGYTPIIAHPERNAAIAEKPERLERLVRRGALAQVTAGSVAGYFGKNVQRLAFRLIEANLIHTYGSDVHNLTTRPFLFNEGLDVMEKKKFGNIADLLLDNNECLLLNESLTLLEPLTPKARKWWKW
ncbi:tyrosine-protein phosphatase [Sporosarcina sp. HYO08]|uniref:tyrosine-protein phosphatase n=1 Tax=Sporosarcina sp. HYO08 TaxID=1759557 RepID=UPI000792B57A|nr:CpsB/CapC family capsule biosynthesis tyrosine phosphatase [Sporosarcina sp. HYO08]KXH86876.1 capsular biosynthesis protein [Sporosarcina sp. HYO08]